MTLVHVAARCLLLCALTAAQYSQYDDQNYYYDSESDEQSYYPATSDYQQYDDDYYDYGQRLSRSGPRYRGDYVRRSHRYYNKPSMDSYEKSSYHQPPKKEYVPVVIKKKKQKKKKILTTFHGFFIRGGTAMFGKFKDIHSCQKACEITPTCFAGDFNPWLGKCFLHSNITACASLSSHKAITHFKKVPCDVTETPRGVVVLGANTIRGIEVKGIESLQDCIKKCVTAGAGIAPNDMMIADHPQICCNIDYDFATHKCFHHACIDIGETNRFCVGTDIQAPVNSVPNPSAVTITFCPLADDG